MSNIFIQIASFRDKQLIPTIKDLLQNSSNPENLTFGICWQHDETESLDEFKDDPRFRILDIPYQESKGCCWARSLCQSLYKDEKYTLQIDSHMRFVPNWDQECIQMIEDLRSKGHKKPMLTGYPPGFFTGEYPEKKQNFATRVVFDKFLFEGVFNLRPEKIEGWENLSSPVVAKYFAAGFYFADGTFIKDVPYDPELFFRGEEVTMTVRAYTYGYDLFHPHKIILWHEYTRKGSPRNHLNDARLKSHRRANVLLGFAGIDKKYIDFGPTYLGTERTIEDYEKFSGLDFKNMNATKCIAIEHKEKKLPSRIPSGIYLQIGCNLENREKYININVSKNSNTDIVTDCWNITGIEKNSVAFIYSKNTIEYISLENARKTFIHWFELLKPTGVINIIVPDIEFHARQILGFCKSSFTDQMQHACEGFWGKKQNGELINNSILWGYTFVTLKKELTDAGFTDIKKFILGNDNEPWYLNVIAKKP